MRIIPLLLASQFKSKIASSSTGNMSRFLQMSTEATDMLQRICDRRFDEFVAVFEFPLVYHAIGRKLLLDQDLKQLTSLSNADGTGLQLTEVRLLPLNRAEKNEIEILRSSEKTWAWSYSKYDSAVVGGTWGYSGRWTSIDTINATMNSVTTTLPTALVTAYEQGQFLKLESEYVYVSNVSATTVTIERAINGSVSAEHLSGVTVYQFIPTPIVRRIIGRLISWEEEQLKAPMFGSVVVGDFSYPTKIDGLPADVADLITKAKLIRRKRVRAT